MRVALVLTVLGLGVKALDWVIGRRDPWGTVATAENGRGYNRILQRDLKTIRLFKHAPGVRVQMHNYLFRTDDHGLRGANLVVPKPEGVRRVFFLGDSIVVACGVEEPDTFVQRSARALTETTGTTWEGINGGHQMHDSTQELAVLREVGFVYEPDLVVLVYCSNDIVSTRATFEAARAAKKLTSPEAQAFFSWSERLRLIEPWFPNLFSIGHFWLVTHRPVGQRGSPEGAKALGIDMEKGWQDSQEAMLAMREECRAHGAAFGIVSFESGIEVTDKLQVFCAESGIPYADVAHLPEEVGLSVRLSRADAHPNARGHELLARRIVEFLLTTPELGVVE